MDTPKTQTVLYDLHARLLTVRSARFVTPRMRRVTFTGDDLAGFLTGAPTDHVKLFFPRRGEERPVMPTVGPNGIVPPSHGMSRPLSRDFTVRTCRPVAREIDIDFVLHGDGPAASWASQASPGQLVGMIGPRGSHIVANDLDWYLIAGDETAPPAIGRWVAEAPAHARVMAVIEVADEKEMQQLDSAANAGIQWVYRNGKESGTTTLLQDAIRAVDVPDGEGFDWIAGEAQTLKLIRRYLLRELELDRDAVDVDGYWRRGAANFDHHTPIEG